MCEIQLIASLPGVMFPFTSRWLVEAIENLIHRMSQKGSRLISFMFDWLSDTNYWPRATVSVSLGAVVK